MQMTADEIIFRYRYRMSPEENRVKVLAELNCCQKEEIAHILGITYVQRRYDNRHKPSAINDEIAIRMHAEGAKDEEIGAYFGLSRSTIRDWRNKKDLVPNAGKRPQKGVSKYNRPSQELQSV